MARSPAAALRDRQPGDTYPPSPGPQARKQAPCVRTEGHPAPLGRRDVQEMLKHAWGDLANFYIIHLKKKKKKKLCFYNKGTTNSYRRGKGVTQNTRRQEDCPKPHPHSCWVNVPPSASFSTSYLILERENHVAMTF